MGEFYAVMLAIIVGMLAKLIWDAADAVSLLREIRDAVKKPKP